LLAELLLDVARKRHRVLFGGVFDGAFDGASDGVVELADEDVRTQRAA